MKVLYVASEAVPFAKTGGLADVAGSLPTALHEDGVDIRVIMPKFGIIGEQYTADMRTHLMAINPAALTTADKKGMFSQPFVGLDFACKGCHNPDGRGPELDDERLQSVATGYHDRDQAGSENR